EEASNAYRHSLDIRERLAAADRSNTQWQRDLSISDEKVGDMLNAQGKLDEALKSYRDSLVIRERLAAADRSNTEWQRDLSIYVRQSRGRVGGPRQTKGGAKVLPRRPRHYRPPCHH